MQWHWRAPRWSGRPACRAGTQDSAAERAQKESGVISTSYAGS